MLVKTIMNRCHKIKGFIYDKVAWGTMSGLEYLEVTVRPRVGSKGLCGKCGRPCSTYDTAQEPRYFEFVPLWGYKIYLLYCMRRVSCPVCGVKTEQIPWADGKHQLCRSYQLFLANWARRLKPSYMPSKARIFAPSSQARVSSRNPRSCHAPNM